MKVLFLTCGGMESASSRYRVYQLLPHLESMGIRCRVVPATWGSFIRRFAGKTDIWNKLIFFGAAVLGRLRGIAYLPWADVVFIQKLVVPHIYPLPELLITWCAKLLRRIVVFDFDDPIFLDYESGGPSFLRRWSDSKRVQRIASCSDAVVVGNNFLAEAVRDSARRLVILPTTLDIAYIRPQHQVTYKEHITIVWTGSPSSEKYLEIIREPLAKIASRRPILLKLIGASRFTDDRFTVERVPWSIKTEYQELATCDIGVMPLFDDDEARGKCGFKLLLYMALGIPAVASPVGVNSEIVQDGENGFLARTVWEWIDKIERLCDSPELRRRFSVKGRKFIEERYSTSSASATLSRLFYTLSGRVSSPTG